MSDSDSGNQKEDTDNDHKEKTMAFSKNHAKKTEGGHQSNGKSKLTKQIKKTDWLAEG